MTLHNNEDNSTSAAVASNALVQEPIHYSLAFLADNNLLLNKTFILIDNAEGYALYVGIYAKQKFNHIHEFYNFTTNISSLTQVWYRYGDLEQAYDWYVSPEQAHASFIPQMVKGVLPIHDYIKISGLTLDFSKLPHIEHPTYYHHDLTITPNGYSPDALAIIGENDHCFFEMYVAEEFEI